MFEKLKYVIIRDK